MKIMKTLKTFEQLNEKENYFEKLKKIKTIALKPDIITDTKTGLKEAFFIIKDAIIELEERIKTIEQHAEGDETM